MKVIIYEDRLWVALPELFSLVEGNITKKWLIRRLEGVDFFFLSHMKMYEYSGKLISVMDKYANYNTSKNK